MYMRSIATSKSIIDPYTHGFFAAKKHFLGKFKREIFVTVYSPKDQEASNGFMFLCEGNVLLFVQELGGTKSILWELEGEDRIESVLGDGESLTKMLNLTPSSEKNLTVSTTNPVKYLLLNGDYVLVCNIQADLAYGRMRQLNIKTIFFTAKNYGEQVDNVVTVLKQILHKEDALWERDMPGIGRGLALLNIYAVTVGFVLMVVLIGLAPLAIGLPLGAILWATALITLLVSK